MAAKYEKQKQQKLAGEAVVEASDTSSTSNVPINPKYKCRGCLQMFSVNSIMRHIANKPNCMKSYSQIDFDDQKNLCKAHQRTKRQKSKKTYYKDRKKQKIDSVEKPCTLPKEDQQTYIGQVNPYVRPENEDTMILKSMEDLKSQCFNMFQNTMTEFVKPNLFKFRHMLLAMYFD